MVREKLTTIRDKQKSGDRKTTLKTRSFPKIHKSRRKLKKYYERNHLRKSILVVFFVYFKKKCACYDTEFRIELVNGPYGFNETERWVRTSGSYTDYCANHENKETKLDKLIGPRLGTTKTICE